MLKDLLPGHAGVTIKEASAVRSGGRQEGWGQSMHATCCRSLLSGWDLPPSTALDRKGRPGGA